ncbi:unnamed protein product [Ectocarpus sp. 12 AP-2014]
MIGGIIAYSSIIVSNAFERRENPGIIISKPENTVYEYPDVWVCLYNNYGCDKWELEEECMRSANFTEGGNTTAVFYPGGEYEQVLPGVPRLTPNNGWCQEFKTSYITSFLGQERDLTNYLDYVLLDVSMYWYPGGFQNDSTTCVSEGWETHSEWIYVFLNDPERATTSTGIQTPYMCISNASASYPSTYLGLGVTKTEVLTGDVVPTFDFKTHVTATTKTKLNPGITVPYAHLALQIQQETNSLQSITEIDPVDIATLLGNVGGFWDLLLILWPIFFVVASRQPPQLKLRSFKNAAANAVRGIGNGSPVEQVGPPRAAGNLDGHQRRLSV